MNAAEAEERLRRAGITFSITWATSAQRDLHFPTNRYGHKNPVYIEHDIPGKWEVSGHAGGYNGHSACFAYGGCPLGYGDTKEEAMLMFYEQCLKVPNLMSQVQPLRPAEGYDCDCKPTSRCKNPGRGFIDLADPFGKEVEAKK